MAKLTLDFEEEYDFELIGICSHIKDYRLSWELNKVFEFDLVKTDDLEIKIKGEPQLFSFFSFIDEENHLEYYLINNRSEYGTLIPEEKKADYFLLIKGFVLDNHLQNLTKEIAKVKNVLTTYAIQVEGLKSKSNLLF